MYGQEIGTAKPRRSLDDIERDVSQPAPTKRRSLDEIESSVTTPSSSSYPTPASLSPRKQATLRNVTGLQSELTATSPQPKPGETVDVSTGEMYKPSQPFHSPKLDYKPEGIAPRPQSFDNRTQRAARTARQIEDTKRQAVQLFRQADQTPDTPDATGISGRQKLRAQAEGKVEGANELARRAQKQYGDLLEIGFGKDTDPNSRRQWAYAKAKTPTARAARDTVDLQAANAERFANPRGQLNQALTPAPPQNYRQHLNVRAVPKPEESELSPEESELSPEEQNALAARHQVAEEARQQIAAQNPGAVSRAILGAASVPVHALSGLASIPRRITGTAPGQLETSIGALGDVMASGAQPTPETQGTFSAGNLGTLAGFIPTMAVGGRILKPITPATPLGSAISSGAQFANIAGGEGVSNREMARQGLIGGGVGAASELAGGAANRALAGKLANAELTPAQAAVAGRVAQGAAGGGAFAGQSALMGQRDPETLAKEALLGAAMGAAHSPRFREAQEAARQQGINDIRQQIDRRSAMNEAALRPQEVSQTVPAPMPARAASVPNAQEPAETLTEPLESAMPPSAIPQLPAPENFNARRAKLLGIDAPPEVAINEQIQTADKLLNSPNEGDQRQGRALMNRALTAIRQSEGYLNETTATEGEKPYTATRAAIEARLKPADQKKATGDQELIKRGNSGLDQPVSPLESLGPGNQQAGITWTGPAQSTGQRLIENTHARAMQMAESGDYTGAITELQSHQRALRDEKARQMKAAKEPGRRVQIERDFNRQIGDAGARIGEIRQQKRMAERQANKPTAGLSKSANKISEKEQIPQPVESTPLLRPEAAPERSQITESQNANVFEEPPAVNRTAAPNFDQIISDVDKGFAPDTADLRAAREYGKREAEPEGFTEEPPTAQLARRPAELPEVTAQRERENLPPLERREALRQAVPKGQYGKISESAYKNRPNALVEHPQLRRLLGLKEMPIYRLPDAEINPKTGEPYVNPEWSAEAQHTLNMLAKMAGKERFSQVSFEEGAPHGVTGKPTRSEAGELYAAVTRLARQKGERVDPSLREAFEQSVTRARAHNQGWQEFSVDDRTENVRQSLYDKLRRGELDRKAEADLRSTFQSVASEYGLSASRANELFRQTRNEARTRAERAGREPQPSPATEQRVAERGERVSGNRATGEPAKTATRQVKTPRQSKVEGLREQAYQQKANEIGQESSDRRYISPQMRVEINGKQVLLDGKEVAKRAGYEPIKGELNYYSKTTPKQNLDTRADIERMRAWDLITDAEAKRRIAALEAQPKIAERQREAFQPSRLEENEGYESAATDIRIRQPKVASRANTIYGNEQAQFFINRAEQRMNEKLAQEKGQEHIPTTILGANLSVAEAYDFAREIRKEKYWWKDAAPEVKAKADAAIDRLADAFKNAADNHSRVLYVAGDRGFSSIRGTMYHELAHNTERLFETTDHWFEAQPEAEKIGNALKERGYEPEQYLSESVAHIVGGQLGKLNLSLDEATNFLDNYLSNITFRAGREAVEAFKPELTAPAMRPALREAQRKYGRQDISRSRQGIPATERAGNERGSGRQIAERSQERAERGREASPEEVAGRKRIRASFGELETEPRGQIAASGLGGLQNLFNRKPNAAKPAQATPLPKNWNPDTWTRQFYDDAMVRSLSAQDRAQYDAAKTTKEKNAVLMNANIDPAVEKTLFDHIDTVTDAATKGDGAALRKARAEASTFLAGLGRGKSPRTGISDNASAEEYFQKELAKGSYVKPKDALANRISDEVQRTVKDFTQKYKVGKVDEAHMDRVLTASDSLLTAGRLGDPDAIREARKDLVAAKRNIESAGIGKRAAYKAWDAAKQSSSTVQALRYGTDWSFAFKQGGPISMNPLNLWRTLKAFQVAYQATGRESENPTSAIGKFSKEKLGVTGAEAVRNMLEQHPMRELGSNHGLKLALDGEKEEIYRENLATKLPWAKRTEAGNQAMLDYMRLNEFGRYVETIDKNKKFTPAQREAAYDHAAELVNTMTGRTNLGEGRIKNIVEASNGLLGAPQLTISRMKMSEPTWLIRQVAKNPTVGKQLAKDAFATAATWGSLLVAGSMAGVVNSSLDPDNPDFLKARFGDTKYDVSFGMKPILSLYFKLGKHAYNIGQDTWDKSEKNDAAVKESRKKALDEAKRFLRSRLGPLSSYAVDLWMGEDTAPHPNPVSLRQVAEPANPNSPWRRLLPPLSIENTVEAGYKQGWKGVAKTAPAEFVGFNVSQQYKNPGRLEKSDFTKEAADAGLNYDFLRKKKDEPDDVFSARKQRVEDWMSTYGDKLINSPRYSLLTEDQKKAAIKLLRDRIGRQQNLKSPKLTTFEPNAVLLGVKKSQANKPKQARKQLWTPNTP